MDHNAFSKQGIQLLGTLGLQQIEDVGAGGIDGELNDYFGLILSDQLIFIAAENFEQL